jgi:aspartate/methionine/tyrosine aminotransferase
MRWQVSRAVIPLNLVVPGIYACTTALVFLSLFSYLTRYMNRAFSTTSASLAASMRLQAVQAPVIPAVAALIREQPGTISLGQGVVHYAPPPEVIARIQMCLANPRNHSYGEAQGLSALKDAIIAKLATENGIEVRDLNRIMITAGSNMGFSYAVLAIAEPGDEFILPVPYYFNHEMAVTMAGCRSVPVRTDADYHLQPRLIENAITARTRAIVTVSPNNPTGAVYSQAALKAVNDICRAHQLYHISDEAYEAFTWDNLGHFSPESLSAADDHTISLFSFSKGYGLAGWRVGFMVLPNALIDAANKIQDTILICPPIASQYAAVGALEAEPAYYRENIRAIGEVRQLVLRQLARLGGCIDPPRSEGGLYVLLRVHTDEHDITVVERLIREYGVAVIPGSAFGIQAGCYLRIAYGALQKKTVAEGIGRLVRGLKALVRG